MEENAQNYTSSKYKTPDGLPVDIVIFTLSKEGKETTNRSMPELTLKVLMIQRKNWPYENCWAFPGGFSDENESLLEAAQRELLEETNVSKEDVFIEQLQAYYQPGRDPRGWMPTVAFYAVVNEKALIKRKAADDAKEVDLISVKEALAKYELAFDHKTILEDAVERVKDKMMRFDLAKEFLPEEFTINEFYQVIKAVVPEYSETKSNFHKKMTKSKSRQFIQETTDESGNVKTTTRNSQGPAKLFKFVGEISPPTLY